MPVNQLGHNGGFSPETVVIACSQPTANALLFAILSEAAVPGANTFTGLGTTWTQIGGQITVDGTEDVYARVFVAKAPASPSAGNATLDYGAGGPTVNIQVFEYVGQNTAVSAVTAIVQMVAQGSTDIAFPGADITATMAAFADSGNATIAVGVSGTSSVSYTGLAPLPTAADFSSTATGQFRSFVFLNEGEDNTPTLNCSANAESGLVIGFEIDKSSAVVIDIDNVDGDNIITEGQTFNIVDAEGGFGAVEGTVEIDGVAGSVTINSWSTTLINATQVANSNRFGFQDLIVKTDSDGDSNPIEIQIEPVSGTGFVDITDVSDHDLSTSPDLKVTDQAVFDDTSSPGGFDDDVDEFGKVSFDTASDINGQTFDYKIWDRVTKTYGLTATYTAESQPSLLSAEIDETSLVATMSRDVVQGTGFDINDFSLTIDAGGRTLTLDDLTGAVLTFSYSGAAVSAGQTVLFSLANSVDGLEATDNGQDAEGFTDFAVTNNAAGADTTPDAFSFTDATNAEPGVQVESNEITISGITAAASIQLSGSSVGGEFSIDGGSYTSAPTTINNGQTLRLRNTSAGFDGSIFTEVDVGGVLGSFTISTRSQDSDPNAFGFTDQTGVEPSTLTESNAITLGVFDFASISVDVGEYRINGGSYTSSPGTVFDGDSVQLRHTSSANYLTGVDQTLTVGGVQDTFTTTTRAQDTVPDAFSFADATNVEPGAVTQSNSQAISGIDSDAPISITGGEYRIDGGSWVSAPGTINLGESVEVRGTSGTFDATVNVTLTIGGVQDIFSITTRSEDTVPNAFGFTDQNNVALSTVIESNIVTPVGFDSAAISITGGEYRLDGGAYTSAPGTITQGQTVQVRHTSSASELTSTNTQLTIGSIFDTFTSTTSVFVNTPPILNDATVSALTSSPEGTLVATIAATDPDAQTLEYTILSGNVGLAFALDSLTGDLTINGTLTESSYSLEIQVDDGEDTDTAIYTVNVTTGDINNPPAIQAASFSISETANIDDIVGTVVAADPDNLDTITFEIVSGNQQSKFAIDSNGQITVVGALRFLTTKRYDLVVAVTDSFGETVGANITITILPATVNYPATQSLNGDVLFHPGVQGGRFNTLYPNNTHVIEVKNLHYSLSKALIDNATITITIKDVDGNNLTGETWPLALVLASSGHYWQGISSALNIDGLTEAVAEVTITTPGGSNAFWSIDLGVSERTL